MKMFYTNEVNTQILVALMKEHGIKKVVVSPGTTNFAFVGSIQHDPFFEMYSSVDERSAAYIACGLSAESGEPVALSCTGATASRNYMPGLTEAFYRKLPILAVTSAQHAGRIGQNFPQAIDRSVVPNDIANLSIQVPQVNSGEDKWACTVQINRALLELKRHGGGPVHINLVSSFSSDFSVQELPKVRVIRRVTQGDELPRLLPGGVAIMVGSHQRWTQELTQTVDAFCEKYDGVVICDQTSNYRGKFRVLASLVLRGRAQCPEICLSPNILIDIGNISGAYMSFSPKQVWRVNPDGEIRDNHKKLQYVFEMEEMSFFKAYLKNEVSGSTDNNLYLQTWQNEWKRLSEKIPEIPFSNAWVAQRSANKMPAHSVLYLGILNTLRVWNFFETPDTVTVYANTGGFGIDGALSSLLGVSLANREQLCFGIVGDLGFFYDMNAIGNRHIGNNIRIMLINNGRGMEFRNYSHIAARFGDDADPYIAAAGHYGKQSKTLVKHYAEDLGFEYLSANDKESFIANEERFFSEQSTDRPIVFEIFTELQNENEALWKICHLETSTSGNLKNMVWNVLGDDGVQAIKRILKK